MDTRDPLELELQVIVNFVTRMLVTKVRSSIEHYVLLTTERFLQPPKINLLTKKGNPERTGSGYGLEDLKTHPHQLLIPARLHFLSALKSSKIAQLSGDQIFQHKGLWGHIPPKPQSHCLPVLGPRRHPFIF